MPTGGFSTPLVFESSSRDAYLPEWWSARATTLGSLLYEAGALLFRGFHVGGVSGFQELCASLEVERMRYVYRSTPRTEVADRIYTSTEYPAHAEIPLHNENAFQRDWPMKLLFYCQQPAAEGGHTSLASTVKVTARLEPALIDRFAVKGVMYVRNYGRGVDLPWQTVFQTQHPEEVEAFCREQAIEVEWLPDGRLRTRQVCQAIATHPVVNVPVWFNQAHLFHVSSVGEVSRKALLSMFKEADLPRHAYYGDGSPIDDRDLETIRDAFRAEKVLCTWRAGDVLVVDNMLVSHGRTAYRGERSLLAAMAEPYSGSAVSSRGGTSGDSADCRGRR